MTLLVCNESLKDADAADFWSVLCTHDKRHHGSQMEFEFVWFDDTDTVDDVRNHATTNHYGGLQLPS